jgi:hypothetical protein
MDVVAEATNKQTRPTNATPNAPHGIRRGHRWHGAGLEGVQAPGAVGHGHHMALLQWEFRA